MQTFAIVIPYSVKLVGGKIEKIKEYLIDLGAVDVKEVYRETWSRAGHALGTVGSVVNNLLDPLGAMATDTMVKNTRYIAVIEYSASRDLQPELEAKVCQEMICYLHDAYPEDEDIWGYLWTIDDYKKGDAQKIDRAWVDGPMKDMAFSSPEALGEGKSLSHSLLKADATDSPRRRLSCERAPSQRRRSRSKCRSRRKSRSQRRSRRRSRSNVDHVDHDANQDRNVDKKIDSG